MISVDNVGAIGMLFDRQPHEIPPEAWSSLINVRCIDKSLFSTYGHQAIMGVPRHNAYFILPTVDITDAILWAYTGLAKISATDGSTHADITRTAGGDYTGTDAALWNGGNFGGITILNNGVDTPQAWITPSLGTPLVNLANWPANTIARVVRPLGRFLVALDVTVSGVRKSTLVKWSDEADIGTVPVTWDPADVTKKAGEWPLLETSGACLDLLPLGDRGIIYKADSIHTMTRIAGRFVFAFKQVFATGILAQRCVVPYDMANGTTVHLVATADDVVMHNGSSMSSVLDDRMQRWYAGRVDQTNAFRSFMAFNYAENEVWTCIPESGATFPNVALITNVKDGTTTVRALQSFSHIDWGRPPGQSQVYDSFTIPFDSMVGYFGQSQGNAARKRMVAVAPLAERNQILQSEDMSTSWTGSAVTIQTNVEGVADRIRPTAANAQHYVSLGYTKLAAEVQTWTFSVKAKADGYGFMNLMVDDNGGADSAQVCLDLSTGAVAFSANTGVCTVAAAGIQTATDIDGYTRYYLTMNTDAAVAIKAYIGVSIAAGGFATFVGDSVSGIRVKEMQLRRGLPGAYQAVTTLPATTGFFLLDAGSDFDGVAFTARAERTGLAIIGQTRTGEPKSDLTVKKLLTEVMPKLEMISGASVNFYVGMQQLIKGPVLWNGPFVFTSETDLNFFPDLEGRLIAVALETSNRELWRLDGYDLEIKNLGKY